MATIKYTGARYLVKFVDGWTPNTPYEPLICLQVEGRTYISKRPVPSNIGSPEANPDYWLLWADPNAQYQELLALVELYRQDVASALAQVDETVEALTQFVNDSVADMQEFVRETTDNLSGQLDGINEKIEKLGSYAAIYEDTFTLPTIPSNGNTGDLELTYGIDEGYLPGGFVGHQITVNGSPVNAFVSKMKFGYEYAPGTNIFHVCVCNPTGTAISNARLEVRFMLIRDRNLL